MTITFADQFKEYQTILTAANALQGAQYTVNWQEFVGGPPIVAAETGGSVDLGDMAETPTIFAQAAGDPVKVVAATVSANPKISPFDLVVPASSSIKKLSQLKGQTIGVQEGTVEQYVLIQILKKAGIPYSAVTIENLSVVNAAAAVSSGKVAAAVISQPLTAIDQAGGKIRVLATGAGYTQTLGYLTASQAALEQPEEGGRHRRLRRAVLQGRGDPQEGPAARRPSLREDLRRHAGRGQGSGRHGCRKRPRRSRRRSSTISRPRPTPSSSSGSSPRNSTSRAYSTCP